MKSIGWSVAFLTTLLWAPFIKAQTAPRVCNGSTWNILSQNEKVMHINGFLAGWFEGVKETHDAIDILRNPPPADGKKYTSTEAVTSADTNATLDMVQQLVIDHVVVPSMVRKNNVTPTPGEILIGINSFYSDAANIPVCWVHAEMIETRSLAGHALDDKTIAQYRNNDGQTGCQF